MVRSKNITAELIGVLSIICSIFCLIYSFKAKNVPSSALIIPFLHIMLFCSCSYNRKYLTLPGLFTLNIMLFLRYQVTFVSYYINDYITKMSYVETNYTAAITLMAFELVIYFVSIEIIYSQKIRVKINSKHEKQMIQQTLPNYSTLESPRAVILSVFVLAILVFLAYTNRSLIGTTDILYGITTNAATEEVSGPIGILWQSLLVVIYLFFIFKYYLNYTKTGNKRYVLFTLAVSIGYLVFIYICQRRISRWYLVVSFIASLFLFSKMYPKNVKGMLLTIGIPVGIILFTGTLYKTSSALVGSGFRNQIEGILNPTNCDAYFAGIGNVTSAIEMSKRFNSSFSNLCQDLINNMPYINTKFDTSQASVDIFNGLVGRTDQIIPSIGQGVYYLTIFLAPLVSFLNVIILRKFDRMFSNSLNMKTFVFSFGAVFTGLLPCLNYTIFLSWLYIRIIPFTIIISVVETYLRNQNSNKIGEVYGS